MSIDGLGFIVSSFFMLFDSGKFLNSSKSLEMLGSKVIILPHILLNLHNTSKKAFWKNPVNTSSNFWKTIYILILFFALEQVHLSSVLLLSFRDLNFFEIAQKFHKYNIWAFNFCRIRSLSEIICP